ncbi:MAG TPA: hypothetical protein VE687_03675, partial [Stellaceae bacterium]|nr:hypothetical protein [Stellaceae bacterium]
QVFGAVAKADTDIEALIRRSLDAVGRTEDTVLTAFTDGCSGLRRILADVDVIGTPMLDWFHIAMRLQHLEQIARALSVDDPARAAAKAVIVEEVDRLHWRLWNGKAKDAQISIERIRMVMHHFRGEQGQRKPIAPARKLWTALHALDGYLTGQSDWMVNDAQRHRNYRRERQFPGQPPDEQVATDALVATRCRPPAPGSLRCLQWQVRFRLRTEILPSQRAIPANGNSCLTPTREAVPGLRPKTSDIIIDNVKRDEIPIDFACRALGPALTLPHS